MTAHLRLLSFAMGLALLSVACGQSAPAGQSGNAGTGSQPLPTIHVRGSVPIWNVQAPILVAKEKGYFNEVGLKDVDFTVGGLDAEVVRGLGAGAFDLQINASTPTTLRAIAEGAPITVLGGFAEQARYSIFVKPGTTAADLKGKTVAVGDLEDFTTVMLKAALRQLGLDPEKDVRMIPAGAPADRMGAQIAGKVDASFNLYNLLPVYASRGLVPLINLHEVKELEPWSLITVAGNTGFVKNNPEATTAFLTAILKARQWYHNPANTAELREILKKNGIEFPSDQAYTFEVDLDREMTPTDYRLPQEYFDHTAAFLAKYGVLSKPVPFAGTVDLSYLEKAKQAAGIK